MKAFTVDKSEHKHSDRGKFIESKDFNKLRG